MLAFITVGSTHFNSLIAAVLTENVLSTLKQKGYTDIVVQCGNSAFEFAERLKTCETHALMKSGVNLEFWRFKPTLEEEYEKADLVISHAGAGTILDVLRKGKVMIVVPNPTLLDNHQEELAVALEEMGHLRTATVETLARVIEEFDPSKIKPFPPFERSRFAKIVDETLGFI